MAEASNESAAAVSIRIGGIESIWRKASWFAAFCRGSPLKTAQWGLRSARFSGPNRRSWRGCQLETPLP
jgi:hypothetical protein